MANITPLSLENAQVALGSVLMKNSAQQIQPVDSVVLDGRVWKESIDYTIGENTAPYPGNHTLFIYGRGNYSGTRSVAYTMIERTAQGNSSSTITPGVTTSLSPQAGVLL